MAIAKVIFNDGSTSTTWMDATTATATAADITAPKTAMLADGVMTTGTGSGGGGGGGATPVAAGVQFIDYDGTLVETWETSDVASQTALPSNPSHTGLTAQGWNWTLADIKSYINDYPDALLTVGQMYITSDGKTRIYIHLDEERKSPMLGCCPNGTVVVDWGDGTATETLTGTSSGTVKWTSTHNYASGGDYVITLEVTSGTVTLSGVVSANQYAYILRYTNAADTRNIGYLNAIQKVEVGADTRVYNYAFLRCYSLAYLTLPSSVTSLGTNSFQYCYSLRYATIPSSMTSGPNNLFGSCYSLTHAALPYNLTSIGVSFFGDCYSLGSICIPGGVTAIPNYAFSGCYTVAHITIPDNVTSVGDYVMQNCRSLTTVIFPSGATSFGQSFFLNCSSLMNANIPATVTSIGQQAFYACNSLVTVTIPSGVTDIGASAFYQCFFLKEIHFLATTPPTCANSNAWTGLPTDCKIYVPTGTLSAYTSATNYPDSSTYTYIEE